MIKFRGIIFLASALVVAFLAAILVSRYADKPETDRIGIAVAAKDIAPGELLTAENVRTASRFKDNVPAGSFPGPDSLAGRIARSHIYKDEPVKEDRLVPAGGDFARGLSGKVKPGMRAVSIKVDAVTGISGMLKQGDLVDVIAVSAISGGESGRISRTILSRVKVLFVKTGQRKKNDKKRGAAGTVVLLLSLDDCKVIAAADGAKLRLAARSYSDNEDHKIEATTYSGALGARTSEMLNKMMSEKDKRLNTGIEKGMRAVTIRVNNEDGICGMLRPGNRVDILASHVFVRTAAPGGRRMPGVDAIVVDSQTYSKIVMQNIEVMAIENDVEAPEDISVAKGEDSGKELSSFIEGMEGAAKKSSEAKTEDKPDSNNKDFEKDEKGGTIGRIMPKLTKRVTFIVTPEDAEKLIVLSTTAEIKLIVRNYDDDEEIKTGGERSNDIFYKTEAKRFYEVNIFKGQKRGQKMFDKGNLESMRILPRRTPPVPKFDKYPQYPENSGEI